MKMHSINLIKQNVVLSDCTINIGEFYKVTGYKEDEGLIFLFLGWYVKRDLNSNWFRFYFYTLKTNKIIWFETVDYIKPLSSK